MWVIRSALDWESAANVAQGLASDLVVTKSSKIF